MDGESLLMALRDGHFEWQGIAFYVTHDLNQDQEGCNQCTPFREEDKRNIIFENQFFAVRDSRHKLISGKSAADIRRRTARPLCATLPN